jgi:DNA-binding transcriptional regulator YdaS (Cro superfamily)
MATFKQHVGRAVAIKGSQAKLATAMGCSQQYISWLLKEAGQISAEMAVAVEKATEGHVSRSDMRPDLFPRQPERAA